MNITDFLLARYAEEEAIAVATRDAHDPLTWNATDYADTDAWGMGGPVDGPSGYASVIVDPARVLAECEAKRRIVERCSAVDYAMPSAHLARGILAEMVAPYADHPDFREEWRAWHSAEILDVKSLDVKRL